MTLEGETPSAALHGLPNRRQSRPSYLHLVTQDERPPIPNQPIVAEWTSSQNTKPELLPRKLRLMMNRLCQPKPGDTSQNQTPVFYWAHQIWQERNKYKLNIEREDVTVRRGDHTWYVRFDTRCVDVDNVPFSEWPGDRPKHASQSGAII